MSAQIKKKKASVRKSPQISVQSKLKKKDYKSSRSDYEEEEFEEEEKSNAPQKDDFADDENVEIPDDISPFDDDDDIIDEDDDADEDFGTEEEIEEDIVVVKADKDKEEILSIDERLEMLKSVYARMRRKLDIGNQEKKPNGKN